MEKTKNQLLIEVDKENDKEKLVQILELTAHKLEVNTISELARIYDISPNGVKSSKRFRKLFVGKQLMAIPNLRDNNKMPF